MIHYSNLEFNINTYNDMISKKFSTFKQSKLTNNIGQNSHIQNNKAKHIDPPPRSFQQIANRNNRLFKQSRENGFCKFQGLVKQLQWDKKNINLIYTAQKQTQHQILNKAATTAIKTLNNKQFKENLNFKSILLQKRNALLNERTPTQDKKIQIAPPSFMKNVTKSFIRANQLDCKNGRKNQYSFNDSLRLLKDQSESKSINISERNSLEDFERASFNNSLKDLSDNDTLNLNVSTQLNKELENINSKIKLILNNSLNFNRRTSQNQRQTNKPSTSRDNEGLSNYHSMAELIGSSKSKLRKQHLDLYESSQNKTKNNSKITINFSKKFQHYKKHSDGQSIVMQPELKKLLQLEDFLLLAQIGSGKYGKVYRAINKQTGFLCALKTISKAFIKQQNIEIPTIRQIKIQLYLNHPNLVKLYGVFADEQTIYLVMQYCSKGTLLKEMKQRVFQEGQIIDILENIFQAVSYMHCHGVIHRDLKPQNIVLQFGQHKLCDFGWAAYSGRDPRTTFCGTPLYVSPQILRGQQHNTKTDVWGLGIITYQLVFGRVPFPICSQSDMIKIINDPVYFPNWANISQDLKKLIKRMLFKNPDDRCSLNELLNEQIFLKRSKSLLEYNIVKQLSEKICIV